ncbi:MAG: hypothetical protein GF329_16275 [Candidatus Lokiarchaeota archaeon]|nr:hypothetical protein [Candidatus Lokiarchaeota archaeon]
MKENDFYILSQRSISDYLDNKLEYDMKKYGSEKQFQRSYGKQQQGQLSELALYPFPLRIHL